MRLNQRDRHTHDQDIDAVIAGDSDCRAVERRGSDHQLHASADDEWSA
jgi:hypothetical protein